MARREQNLAVAAADLERVDGAAIGRPCQLMDVDERKFAPQPPEVFRLPLRREIARYFQTTVHKKSLRHLLYAGGIVDFTRNRLPPEKSAAAPQPPARR